MWIAISLTLVALIALLVAEYADLPLGIWTAKPLASTGFLLVALAAGALDAGGYGYAVLAALVLSWWGDVFLIPKGRAAFSACVLIFPVVMILRWLGPKVPSDMALPVYAYVAAISAMLICATGASVTTGNPRILLGAAMFYTSDLAVARDRFVTPGFSNRAWGLPLYYGGQLVLATTV
ncbi:MAG: hypothetical protein JRH01_21670 [Deltaproteobacteria bacterium]|nr:hypothetical protein [Deltaproteobacteria bacterium]MBW2361983.1 hypothetical protein [Deltaproteobacteria bacterium]